MQALQVGDPLKESTEIGPLATEQILKDVDEQVKTSVAAGAFVLTGGKRVERQGNFYEPTVLVNVPKDSPASCEEVFGPVAMLFRATGIDEAIEIANATSFGLGAAAWTNDANEQERFIDELEAGCVSINGMVASDPRLPFGGVKNSGYGRELGEFGIREFVNVKTVWIQMRVTLAGVKTGASPFLTASLFVLRSSSVIERLQRQIRPVTVNVSQVGKVACPLIIEGHSVIGCANGAGIVGSPITRANRRIPSAHPNVSAHPLSKLSAAFQYDANRSS